MPAGGEHAAGRIPPSGARPGLGPAGRMGGRMPGMPGRGGGEETEWVGIVDWDETDYSRLGPALRLEGGALDAGRRAGPGRPLGVRGAAAGHQGRQ